MSVWSPAGVERELRALGAAVEFPPEPNLATAVGDRLRGDARTRIAATAPRRAWLLRPRRAAVALTLALVLLVTAVLAISPAAREAVARWLGIRGARIEVVPTPPSVPGTPGPPRSPIDLLLGTRVTLAEARDLAGFELVMPAGLGAPDAVFVDDRLPGGRVTLAYEPTPEHPVSEHTGYGLLLTQFRGDLNPQLIGKLVPEGGEVTPTNVRGRPAYFVDGEHVLRFLAPDGTVMEDTLRLAGPTLLWERGSLTLRLEGDLTLREARALAIAASAG